MDKISCGVIIRKENTILACFPTNGKYWNIPKGIKEENEDYWSAAKRETLEETNIDLNEELFILNRTFPYLEYYKGKRLYLFELIFNILPDINNLKCSSMFFNKYKNMYETEISKFKYIDIKQYDKYFNPNLIKVFRGIYKNEI